MSRLLWLRIPVLDDMEPGDLMSRVSADTTLLRQVSTQTLVAAVTSVLTLVATATLMALLDPLLLAVTLAALVMAQVVISIVVPRIRRATKQAQESVGAMSTSLERVLGALRTVKASGAEERERARLDDAATRAWQGGVRAAKWQAVAGNIGGLAIQVAFIVVLGLGGARVVSGAIDVGTLVAFLLYLFYLMPPCGTSPKWPPSTRSAPRRSPGSREVETMPTEPLSPHATVEYVDTRPASVAFESVRFRTVPTCPRFTTASASSFPARGMTRVRRTVPGAGKTTVL